MTINNSTTRVATIPCNLSLMARFADINVSQGSVATNARSGGIVYSQLTANLPGNLPVKNIVNRLRLDRIRVQVCVPTFLRHPAAIHTDNDCLEDSSSKLFRMYSFSWSDMNLLVAGVLLAITAHMSSATADDMPATCQHDVVTASKTIAHKPITDH